VERTVSGVLKKSEVWLAPESAGDAPATARSGGAQARIVAQSDTEAVIEVTCPCGRKTRLRCAYARPAPRAGS
jgi:hypothetical protein